MRRDERLDETAEMGRERRLSDLLDMRRWDVNHALKARNMRYGFRGYGYEMGVSYRRQVANPNDAQATAMMRD